MITDGDLRRALENANPESWIHLKARDLMTIDPICIEKNQLAYKAIQIMEKNRKKPVSVLPVLDSKKQMCGIIRLYDLIQEDFDK